MTPELFINAAKVLYGAHWQQPLAQDLDVTPRTLRRWSTGAAKIPPRVVKAMCEITQQRTKALLLLDADLVSAWLDILSSPRYAPKPQQGKGPQL